MTWPTWLILAWLPVIAIFAAIMRHRERAMYRRERMELLEQLKRMMDGEE